MKSRTHLQRFLTGLALIALCACARLSGLAASTNVFFTQFEFGEGYSTNYDLAGQKSWTSEGTGGNGILAGFFPGQGQQAYLGFSPPDAGDDQLVVWPTNQFNPVALGLPVVKFSVQMQVADSSNGNYDFFQWRAYNRQGKRLFIIDFDNYFTNINYRLDGTNNYVDTGVSFAPDTTYTLFVTMNFASNRWSASLDNTLIVTNLPMTTTNAQLSYGDMDAVWLLYDTNAPGDNYLLFDNYHVTAETLPAPASQVQFLGRTSEGWALVRVLGTDGFRWSLDGTTNFVNWTALKTNTISSGFFDHVDMTATPFSRRFYRARLVP
ncbi:MAG: hypothetical protein U1F83_05100 [Verrucomicrobiota bacterium]